MLTGSGSCCCCGYIFKGTQNQGRRISSGILLSRLFKYLRPIVSCVAMELYYKYNLIIKPPIDRVLTKLILRARSGKFNYRYRTGYSCSSFDAENVTGNALHNNWYT